MAVSFTDGCQQLIHLAALGTWFLLQRKEPLGEAMSPQPQQYPLVPVQFLLPVPVFTHLNLHTLDHLFPVSLRILGALAFGKWVYVE